MKASFDVLVLTPTTMRPGILEQTYQSFYMNMFQAVEDRLDINAAVHVDNVFNFSGSDALDMVDIVKAYLPIYYAEANLTGKCSLARSFHWLWAIAYESQAKYVFYLEDDWELLQSVSLLKMIRIMEDNPNLATLRLNFKPSQLGTTKQWAHFFPWNGQYFECPESLRPAIGWCGHPSLVNTKFIGQTYPFLNAGICPEHQMKGNGLAHDKRMREIIRKWDYGVFGQPDQSPYVKDLGRVWRTKNRIVKYADTTWKERKYG